ncbi:MAG: DUF4340 domain-containing protein [Candidatus Coatesbacteria bacterium]|nr:DUF4340 domain-containing protein [Candidatus Coatesbacteria bacterium]
MRSRILEAVVLPSVAVLLGAYYVLFEYRASDVVQPPPRALHLFPDLAAEHISKLEVRTSDRELLVVKQEGRWVVMGPQKAPANQDEVARLIHILQKAEYTRRLHLEQVGGGSEQFGLSRPSLMVSISSEDPRTQRSTVQTVHFGAMTPSGSMVYANAPGSDDLLLVDMEISNQISYFLFVPPLEAKTAATSS